ncbi:hypothetical protein PAXINDRAFT_93488 [Paxillus involutus ATCC 200175]|uniref:Uncharacterized protein n=1 Tax=Paxillus involutus ATCC 200175 TaxID=664439 RepID=A0A0C9STG0_PAXIN|nr:hypothetical protein PAXINDRAFT_93488 [Paxillus involutus ATCC 200175]
MCQHFHYPTPTPSYAVGKLEFEVLYYQLKESCIHFVHPAVHQVLHLVTEAIQKGPPIFYAHWTMEHTIGNLEQKIQQPSKPFSNLAQEDM